MRLFQASAVPLDETETLDETIQMVLVAPLTPEQKEARRKEVFDATMGRDLERLEQAIEAAIDGFTDLNYQNWAGMTSVFVSAREGYQDSLSKLITAGADVNTSDNWGQTPYYIATHRRNTECIHLLKEGGADGALYLTGGINRSI